MPKLAPEIIAERRQSILRACLKQFATRGFHRTSMRDLCRELKLSAGALYGYFPSKEAIIEAMVIQDQERWAPFFTSLSPQLSFAEQLDELEALAEGCAIGNVSEGEMMALWWQVMAEAATNQRVAEVLRQHYDLMTGEITKLVERGQASGEVTTGLAAQSIAVFMIASFDGLFARVAFDPKVDFKKTAAEFKQLISLALVAPATKKAARKS